MTVTESHVDGDEARLSLSTRAARNLATTTKTRPQMQGITPRWLLRSLPWVEAPGGTYRVNRRLTYTLGDGLITVTSVGSQVRVVPLELTELPLLQGFDDEDALNALADRFEPRDFEPGDVLTTRGEPVDRLVLVASGKIDRVGTGKYGDEVSLGVSAEGEFFGDRALADADGTWPFTARAITGGTVLTLSREAVEQVTTGSAALRDHIADMLSRPRASQTRHGEASIELASGHDGEPDLPGTFVDYEPSPREYELSVAQTILRIHTRVADLYNQPMNQTEQQLRLTIEALRERQEHELLNNREFGLLHNVVPKQRVQSRSGPPTPQDLDELISRRRKSRIFLAHPRTIAAFGRECTRQGVYPDVKVVDGEPMTSWRGVPLLPSDKIPVSPHGTTSILCMRLGEEDAGVIGLHQTGLPDEVQPGLSVRFMGISTKAVLSYQVSAYYSVAVLVPDAVGVLDNVEIGR